MKKGAPPPPQRRVKTAERGDAEERVHRLTLLMASGTYITAVTPSALAEEWRISVGQVHRYAAEASRRVRWLTRNSGELRSRMMNVCETLIAKAASRSSAPNEKLSGTAAMAEASRDRNAIEAVRTMAGLIDADERSTVEAIKILGSKYDPEERPTLEDALVQQIKGETSTDMTHTIRIVLTDDPARDRG
jgi:hypothetical protein